jgi:hypothetical protein
MSALPPIADIETQSRNVCFVPKADIAHRGKIAAIDVLSIRLFDRWHSPSAVDCSSAWGVQEGVGRTVGRRTLYVIGPQLKSEAVKPLPLNFPLPQIVVASVSCQSNVCTREKMR